MMKYAWLPALILLGAVGCHSEAYYREQAVESAREFIYKHARELTAEQYSVVKFNPPVILYGPIFKAVGTFQPRESVLGEEQRQICVTWRIPGAETDYLVYGVSEPRMVYWKPLRLIRRRIAPRPQGPGLGIDHGQTVRRHLPRRAVEFRRSEQGPLHPPLASADGLPASGDAGRG